MLDYRQLAAFGAVVEQGSFERAAQQLHITQSAVSQRIRQLEERLGCMLVVRANPLYPTAEGARLLGHFRQVRFLEQELLVELTGEQEQPFLRIPIAVNADSLATWFLQASAPLVTDRRLLLELQVEDQDQTHHLLKRGEVIGCISTQSRPLQGGEVSELGSMEYITVASPEYLAQHFPQGVTRAQLRRAPAVIFNQKDELLTRYLQQHYQLEPGAYPAHRVPSAQSFVDLALNHLAYVLVPRMQVAQHLREGELLELAPGRNLEVLLYWHNWRLQSEIGARLSAELTRIGRRLLKR